MVPIASPEDLDRQEREATESLLRALAGVDTDEGSIRGGDACDGGMGVTQSQFLVSDKEVEDDYLALLAEAGLEDDGEGEGLNLVGMGRKSEDEGDMDIGDLLDDSKDSDCDEILPPLKKPKKDRGSPPPSYTKVVSTEATAAKIKRLKAQALAAKREGNMSLAKQHVMAYKALQEEEEGGAATKSLPSIAAKKKKVDVKANSAEAPTEVTPGNAVSIDIRMKILKEDIAAAKVRGDYDTARVLFQELKVLKVRLKNGESSPSMSSPKCPGSEIPPFKTLTEIEQKKQTKKTLTERKMPMRKGKQKSKQAILSSLQRDIMAVRKKQTEAMNRGDNDAAGSLYKEFLELNERYQATLGMKASVSIPENKKVLKPTGSAQTTDKEVRDGLSDDLDLDLDNVELSDGDEEDPDMLAALSAIEAAEEDESEEMEAPPNALDTSAESKPKVISLSQRIMVIEEEMQTLKVSAVMAKRKGDLAEAKALMSQFKQRKIEKSNLMKESKGNISEIVEASALAEDEGSLDATSENDAKIISNAPVCISSETSDIPKGGPSLEKEIAFATEATNDVTLHQELTEIKSQINDVEVKLNHLKKRYKEAKQSGDKSLVESLLEQCKQCISDKKELLVIYNEITSEIGSSDKASEQFTGSSTNLNNARGSSGEPAAPATPTSASDVLMMKEPSATSTEIKKTSELKNKLQSDVDQDSRQRLMALIKELQLKALAAKRAGDIDKCKKYFTEYKALQKDLENMPLQPANLAPAPDKPEPTSRLTILEASAQQARARALKYKKEGDLTAAKQELAQYKLLKSQMSTLLINGGVDIPVSAQKEAQRTNAERNEAVDSLDKIVVEEVALIQRVIKLGKASKDTALITKLAKALSRAQSQRKTLSQYRPGGSFATRPLPKRCTRTVIDHLNVQNLDVAPNTMQLVIHSIRDVPYKGDADRAINAFVKFDFGYPQSAPIKGQTSIVAGKGRLASFDENFSLGLRSGRLSSKATLRHFEKRRVKFSIWHRKTGIFSSEDVCLGNACADLAPLLARSVMKEIEVPLFQESRRRPSGGHLRLTMKLRKPLQGEDVRSIQRQMLVLE